MDGYRDWQAFLATQLGVAGLRWLCKPRAKKADKSNREFLADFAVFATRLANNTRLGVREM